MQNNIVRFRHNLYLSEKCNIGIKINKNSLKYYFIISIFNLILFTEERL